jgi:polar amino acid transport system permease protein
VKYQWHWDVIYQYRELLLDGLLATMELVVAALPLSVLLGLTIAIGRTFPARAWSPLAKVCGAYVEFFRNIPAIVQFFFWSFAVGLNAFPAALVALSVSSSAYIAEIFRAGIASIPRAQKEAARSSGLSEWQAVLHVILPQAVIRVIPPLSIEFINIVKNSSVAMTIGFAELTFATQEIEARSFRGFEAATIVTALYVLLSSVIVIAMHLVERAVRLEVRKG